MTAEIRQGDGSARAGRAAAGQADCARPKLDILLVCNAAAEHERILGLLAGARRATYRVEWHSGYGGALRAIGERRHDVILIDVRLDDGLGVNLLREAAEDAEGAAVLFGLPAEPAMEVWALGSGAADCLFEGEMTASVLDRALTFAHERRCAARRLEYLTNYDAETGLANRGRFREVMNLSVARARRNDTMLALFFIGLDHLASAMETVGVTAHDRLLAEVVARLKNVAPQGSPFARLGDETFGLLIESLTSLEEAEPVAVRLTSTMSRPIEIDGHDVFVAANVGIATYPLCGWDADTLVSSAATAMSRARAQGHNTFQFHTRKMTALELQRLVLRTGLHRALERDEFTLHYQPQVDLRTSAITGVEALVRWRHRDFGLLNPTEFIPVAEETGLIIPLGRWVIATACRQVRTLEEQGLPPLRLSINVAQRQFREPGFPQFIGKALHSTGLPANRLCLEITEGTLMEDTEASQATLARFRDMGVGVSIDDFGTGYSSLGYLKRFPLDTLKIDKSFVRDVTTDAEDAAIATAVIGLAHNLRLTVIAEGVETAPQLAFFRHQGCDAIQGDYFSRPVAPEALPRLVCESPLRI
jgi:diguanylate cyclase (GGDEF)-like protein